MTYLNTNSKISDTTIEGEIVKGEHEKSAPKFG